MPDVPQWLWLENFSRSFFPNESMDFTGRILREKPSNMTLSFTDDFEGAQGSFPTINHFAGVEKAV
jgi:hypothetical protein